ncbi:TPR-like protein [Atractiella rhizophila]|nr:TPR-like protein [Atractiella rhizophila]
MSILLPTLPPFPLPPTRILEIPLSSSTSEAIEINLDELDTDQEALDEVRNVFTTEKVGWELWVRVAVELWRRGLEAGEMINGALKAFPRPGEARFSLLLVQICFSLSLSRVAPRVVLGSRARRDQLPSTSNGQPLRTKDEYLSEAMAAIDQIELTMENVFKADARFLEAKGQVLFAQGKVDEAGRIWDDILRKEGESLNICALFGKARTLLLKRSPKPALKIYQELLQILPHPSDARFEQYPDPRLGIGLCFWNLGDKEMAWKAWKRSELVNGGERRAIPAMVLMGISFINHSKSSSVGSEGDAENWYKDGITYLSKAWKASGNYCASAAAAMSLHAITIHEFDRAIKFAERAMQFSDSKHISNESQVYLARALHGQGHIDDAQKEYKAQAYNHIIANLAVGQRLVQKHDYPAAVNAFENIFRRNSHCIEALLNLSALHYHQTYSSMSHTDASKWRKEAKSVFETLFRLADEVKALKPGANVLPWMGKVRRVMEEDHDWWAEAGRLWTDEDPEKALRYYRQAEKIRKQNGAGGPLPSQWLNNIGVCLFKLRSVKSIEGLDAEAEYSFQQAMLLEQQARGEEEGALTHITFNLGVVYEVQGKSDEAKEIYGKILERHPEYVDAKVRLACMHLDAKDYDSAHELLKQALQSQSTNSELRCMYSHFLLTTRQDKLARDFATETLRRNKNDIYSLCVVGNVNYSVARENKRVGPEANKDRAKYYLSAAECFDKALKLDPHNAYAAQGLAICLADHALGALVVAATPQQQAAKEAEQRERNSRDAMNIFLKVRESLLNEGSVYVNIGHCHALREDNERAIESFSIASDRFYKGQNHSVLLYLAMSWFHKAQKAQDYNAMQTALGHCIKARDLALKDDSIPYNVAMIQQKGLEILLELPNPRRKAAQLKEAIGQVKEAQQTFAALSKTTTFFDPELAHQRHRYSSSLLNKAEEVLAAQEEWERGEEDKLAKVQGERMEEQKRRVEEAAQKQREYQERQKETAEKRKIMLAESQAWTAGLKGMMSDSDEEGKKKRKRTKKKIPGTETLEDGEDGEDSKRKRRKKRVVEDGDEEQKSKRRKVYKSKEIISSSDEEDDAEPQTEGLAEGLDESAMDVD